MFLTSNRIQLVLAKSAKKAENIDKLFTNTAKLILKNQAQQALIISGEKIKISISYLLTQ